MSTLDLFDPPTDYPPARPTRTSRDAARKLAPVLSKREAMVLRALLECGPSSPDELAAHLKVDRTVTRPRCTMMATKGVLTVTGELRETGLGGRAEVYAITSKGRAKLEEL